MRGELIAELDDGLHWIGLRWGCPGVARRRAVRELARSEEAIPRQVLDVRPIKQPIPTSEIDLLIAHAEAACQDHLRWRQHPLGEPRLLLELVLVLLDLAQQFTIRREHASREGQCAPTQRMHR